MTHHDEDHDSAGDEPDAGPKKQADGETQQDAGLDGGGGMTAEAAVDEDDDE